MRARARARARNESYRAHYPRRDSDGIGKGNSILPNERFHRDQGSGIKDRILVTIFAALSASHPLPFVGEKYENRGGQRERSFSLVGEIYARERARASFTFVPVAVMFRTESPFRLFDVTVWINLFRHDRSAECRSFSPTAFLNICT